jgi:hypothetical protein
MPAEESSEELMVGGLEEPALTPSNTIEKPGTKTLNQKVESANRKDSGETRMAKKPTADDACLILELYALWRTGDAESAAMVVDDVFGQRMRMST